MNVYIAIAMILIGLEQIICANDNCRFGSHGMNVFAKNRFEQKDNNTAYFSHIPMYGYPHDYQFLFQVKLNYSINNTKDESFTFLPEQFCLDSLINGTLKQFKGDLYRGNFEQGGIMIMSNLSVNLTKKIFANNVDERNNTDSFPSYVAFGYGNFSGNVSRKEVHLLHVIQGKTNFDHALQIYVNTTSEVEDGSIIKFDREVNLEGKRPSFNRQYNGSIWKNGKSINSTFFVKSELWCLVGPDFSDNCTTIRSELKFFSDY